MLTTIPNTVVPYVANSHNMLVRGADITVNTVIGSAVLSQAWYDYRQHTKPWYMRQYEQYFYSFFQHRSPCLLQQCTP